MKEKIKVLQLINSMDPGGAENLLASQLPYFNYDEFEIYIGYLYGDGSLLKNRKGNYKAIDFSKNKKFTYFAPFRIFKFVIKNKIDIIHTHLIQASIFGRFIGFIYNKIPVITTRHYGEDLKEYRLINKIENFSEKYCTKLICVSNYVKDYVSKNIPIQESKLRVIYNGIDLNYFHYHPVDQQNKYITIGAVSRLIPIKGIDTLIKCITYIKERFSNITFEIVGDGPERESIEKLIAKLGIDGTVKLLGRRNPDELLKIMSKWDIFVHTSYRESFGMVVIEAMALGKPIVASNIPALREILRDGENGYLCLLGNYKDFAEKILILCKDRKKRKEFSINCRKRVEKLFEIRNKVLETEKLYYEVISES